MHAQSNPTRRSISTSASAARYVAKIRTLEIQASLIAGELEGTRVALIEARRNVREVLTRQKVLRMEASAIRRRRAALDR